MNDTFAVGLAHVCVFTLFMFLVLLGAEQEQKAHDMRNQENVVIRYDR